MELVTRGVIATHYGIPVRTLNKWLTKGMPKSYRIDESGNRILVVQTEDVDPWFKEYNKIREKFTPKKKPQVSEL